MDLSMATNQELADECFLRHGITQLDLQIQGITIEEARVIMRDAREAEIARG